MKYLPSLVFIIALWSPFCLCMVVPARNLRYHTNGISDKDEAIPYLTRLQYLKSSHRWKRDPFSIRQGSPSNPPKPPLTDKEVQEKFKEHGYDPDGDGEVVHALKNFDEVLTVSETRDNAFERESKEYPEPGMGHNDEADAFRHAYFNAKLTSEIGAKDAKGWADAHEVSGDNPVGETLMDLHNNAVGRKIGERLDNPTDDEIADAVREAISKGELLTEPVPVQNPSGTTGDSYENNQYNSD